MIPDHLLASEQQFFNREAAALTDADLRVSAQQIERYRHARPGALNIPLDSIFAYLLPLEGKEVLDYGCGRGENAVVLAACGARVTAFDLSAVAIAKARRRAELHGLADRIQFDVRKAGQTNYAPASFDVVLGSGILHHLHAFLPAIYEEIARLLKPGGTACFVEPMANSRLLRAARRLIPLKTYATEGERQLVYQDLEPLRRHFSTIAISHFYCLERLRRLLGERVAKPLRWLDYQALRLFPFLEHYYGQVLILARR